MIEGKRKALRMQKLAKRQNALSVLLNVMKKIQSSDHELLSFNTP